MLINRKRTVILSLILFLTFNLFIGCEALPVSVSPLDLPGQSASNYSDEKSDQKLPVNSQPEFDELVPLLTLSISADLYLVDFETRKILPFPGQFNSHDAFFADSVVIYGTGYLKGERLKHALNESTYISGSSHVIPFDEAKTWLWSSNYFINENLFFRPNGQDYDVMDINTGNMVARGKFPLNNHETDSGSNHTMAIPTHGLLLTYSDKEVFRLDEDTWRWIEMPGLNIDINERLVVSPDSNYLMVTGHGKGEIWSIEGKTFNNIKTFESRNDSFHMNYAVSSDMKFVVAYDYHGYIEVFDGFSSSLLFHKQTNCISINDIAFSHDNRYLVFSGFCDEPSWGFIDLNTQDTVMQFYMFDRAGNFDYIYLQSDIYQTIYELARQQDSNNTMQSVVPKSMESLVEEICSLSLPGGYTYGATGIGSQDGVPFAYCVIEGSSGTSTLSSMSTFPDRKRAIDSLQAQYESLQEFWKPSLQKIGEDDQLIITNLGFEYDFIFTACTTTFNIRFSELAEFEVFLSNNLGAIQQYACNLN